LGISSSSTSLEDLTTSFSFGALVDPSRKPTSCAPHSTARTWAFHTVWFVRTSFSDMGIKTMAVGAELEVAIELLDVTYEEE
jgi:hypothetical protein